jgi:hypothetical protein
MIKHISQTIYNTAIPSTSIVQYIYLTIWGVSFTSKKKVEFRDLKNSALFFKSILGFSTLKRREICPM